jgi:hypothetical protein
MPKKIDWDSVRRDFIEGNLTYAALAERHGLSRQSVEKRGADEGWQALRQAFQRQQSMMVQSERDSEKFDLDELLKKAIALSFQQLEVSQPCSFEKAADSICKLSEIYFRLHPPRPPTVAAWVDKALEFELDIVEIAKKIKERVTELGSSR